MFSKWLVKNWLVVENLNGRKTVISRHLLKWGADRYVKNISKVEPIVLTRKPSYSIVQREEWEASS